MTEAADFPIARRSLLLAASLAPFAPAWAQGGADSAPAVPPIETFFRAAGLRGLRLSPAGTHVAGIRPYEGRENLIVVDLATRKTLVITNFRDADVQTVQWVNNERLLLSLYDRSRGTGDQLWGGLYAIRRDGTEYMTLAERSLLSDGRRLLPYGSEMVVRVPDAEGRLTDEIIAETPRKQGRGRYDVQLYRVNVATGHFTAVDLSGAPKQVANWTLDADLIPRAATTVAEDGTTSVHFRDSAQAPWRVLLSYGVDDLGTAIMPLAFDRAGTLYVASSAGTDFQGIYTVDTRTGKLNPDPVVAVKGFDLGDKLIFSKGRERVVGISFEADAPMTVWFDDERRKLQAAVDEALPGMVNTLQVASEDASRKAPVLVFSRSDRDPGRYLLFDRETQRLVSLGAVRPWVRPEQMQPTRFFRYDVSDGLSIPAQLTTPPTKGPFPLVVLHYGGPWVRPIHYGWDEHVQFLVSRGYAVFMPAPRASRGFGNKLFRAGWKQWGLGMQDDVTAGVRKLIADGVADPKRVALVGASYGGYLTMMGLVKEPALFRCGVNWIGVTDPGYMFSVTWSDFSRAENGRFLLEHLLGDPETDKAQLERTSPLKRAAEIKQPVLMAYGGLDERVPLIHGEHMRDALKPHNHNVEWVVYPDEGHGWLRYENQLDFWGRVERFLARHLKA
jgi:dipeptidyl aminopeptidase/acylaminoacyl peptidase